MNELYSEEERYEFTWAGKREAREEARRAVTKVLRPAAEDSVNWDSTENLYLEGDNLDVLKLLQKSCLSAVKVIYIDPPYNTGNNFIYSDGRYHSDWCSMIYARLLLARNLLSPGGAIFLSIDDHEQANLRKICDEVFGEKNFVACFVWNCSTGGGIRPKFASRAHEYILCYARDKAKLSAFSAPLSEAAVKLYNREDERGAYRDKDFVFKNKSVNPNQKYGIVCPDGETVFPKEGYIYRFVKKRFEEALSEGLVTFKRTTAGPLVNSEGEQAHWNIYIKKYLGDATGAPSTLIPKTPMSIYNAGTRCVQDLFDGTRVFENVKPVRLIQYLINMVAGDGDLVMDFFSGSATTAQAVMQSEIDRRINLHYILVQIPEACGETSDARRAGYATICEIGKERIRRAAEKLRAENDCRGKDFGFRVFRTAEADSGEEAGQNRTELDLLFGCAAEWGMPLSLPYAAEQADGYTLHCYNGGELIACFDENPPDSLIEAIAKRRPRRAVFRGGGFCGGRAGVGAEAIFARLSPDTEIKIV